VPSSSAAMTASTSFATDQRPSDGPTAKNTRRSGCHGRPRFRGTRGRRSFAPNAGASCGDPHDPIRENYEEPPAKGDLAMFGAPEITTLFDPAHVEDRRTTMTIHERRLRDSPSSRR
jgi:hypothetical protein